jgi:tetratricopeptide (TPR) repeat protein
VPAQLPVAVAAFTGRGRQLEELDAALLGRDDEQVTPAAIAVITGSAGVGKTALAVRWAHRVRDLFPDGQLFADLHGYSFQEPAGPLEVLTALLRALGVPGQRVPVDLEEAAGLYRSLLAGRRILVVLDNANGAVQVRPLLPGSLSCRTVITSRDSLSGLVAREGAHRISVEVLPPEEARLLLARTIGDVRVAAEPGAAGELARLCAHLPLALRIAAAHLTGRPEQTISSWLARLQVSDLLVELAVAGDPNAAVATAFDCSYAVLDTDAKRLFRLLGQVPGPDFTGEGAAALTGFPTGQAQRLLARLAAAHLVEPRAPGRFGFHDLLRLYARQRAERQDGVQERQGAIRRLLSWYVHTADSADRLTYPQMLRLPVPQDPACPAAGFGDRSGALSWLDAERPNLIAAIKHAAADGPRPMAWLLADALRNYLWAGRHMVDWLAAASAAVSAARANADPLGQAAAQRGLGLALYFTGDHRRALKHHTKALAFAREEGWAEGEAAALSALSMVYADAGELQHAAQHYTQALALHRQLGSTAGQAVTLMNLGEVSLWMGCPKHALAQLTQALALHGRADAHGGKSAIFQSVGMANHLLGRLKEAESSLVQSLDLARKEGNRYFEPYTLAYLAAVHRDVARVGSALELAEDAVGLARENSDPRAEAEALNSLGSIHLCLGDDQRAAEHHLAALELTRQSSARYVEVEALLGLAASCHHSAKLAEARQYAQQARVLSCQGGFRILEGRACAILAAVHLDCGHHEEVAMHVKEALAIFVASDHRLGHAYALESSGKASTTPGTRPGPRHPGKKRGICSKTLVLRARLKSAPCLTPASPFGQPSARDRRAAGRRRSGYPPRRASRPATSAGSRRDTTLVQDACADSGTCGRLSHSCLGLPICVRMVGGIRRRAATMAGRASGERAGFGRGVASRAGLG